MEQRHQMVVIANVGSQYRVLAALHHEPMSIYSVKVSVLSVLEQLSRKANLPGIRRELQKAGTLDWERDIWTDGRVLRAHEALFPFIATCLIVSSAFGSCTFGDNWKPQVRLMPINWQFDRNELANIDSISIYDITDVGEPRYGFMFPGKNVLMDADRYLREYRSEWALIDRLREYGTISLAAMISTWPGCKLEVDFGHVEPETTVLDTTERRTLKEQSLRRLLDIAFESDGLEWVAEAELVPDFQPALLSRIASKPALVQGPRGIELLITATKGRRDLDLSLFSISPAELSHILPGVWGSELSSSRLLILPDLHTLTKDDLQHIVRDYAPTTLNLGDTPQVSFAEILSVISGSSVVHFNCSAQYHRSLDLIALRGHRLPAIPASEATSNAAASFPITQMVFLCHRSTANASDTPRTENGSVEWSSLKGLNSIWRQNDYNSTLPLAFPLKDCLISPERASTCLSVLRHLWRSTLSDRDLLWGVIRDLAKDISHSNIQLPIQPLAAEMFEEYRRYCFLDKEHPPKFSNLAHGQWTFLVTCDIETEGQWDWVERKRTLRYGFLTLDGNDDVRVEDADGFFRAVVKGLPERFEALSHNWQARQSEIGKGVWSLVPTAIIGPCDAGEVDEALRYLEDYNAKIDAYEEWNKDILAEDRKMRLDSRENERRLPVTHL